MLPRGLPDHRGRRRGEDVGGVVGLLGGVGDEGAVHVQQVVVVGGGTGEGDPPVPARRDVGGGRVRIQVLADQGRPVARVVEPRGQGGGVPEDGEAAQRGGVVPDARGVGVPSGEDGRPAGAAQGAHGEGVFEPDAPGHELRLGPGHGPEGVGPLVVGEDQDDVRGPGPTCGSLQRNRGQEQQDPEGEPHTRGHAPSAHVDSQGYRRLAGPARPLPRRRLANRRGRDLTLLGGLGRPDATSGGGPPG